MLKGVAEIWFRYQPKFLHRNETVQIFCTHYIMGKSYKKEPVFKDTSKGLKRLANKRVRQTLRRNEYDFSGGKSNIYKKIFNSGDIYYWIYRYSLEDKLSFERKLRDLRKHESLSEDEYSLIVDEWKREFYRK